MAECPSRRGDLTGRDGDLAKGGKEGRRRRVGGAGWGLESVYGWIPSGQEASRGLVRRERGEEKQRGEEELRKRSTRLSSLPRKSTTTADIGTTRSYYSTRNVQFPPSPSHHFRQFSFYLPSELFLLPHLLLPSACRNANLDLLGCARLGRLLGELLRRPLSGRRDEFLDRRLDGRKRALDRHGPQRDGEGTCRVTGWVSVSCSPP